MAVKIPNAHKEPLKKLIAMDAPSRSHLVAAIQHAKAELDPEVLIAQVKKSVNFDVSSIDSIIWMLISMYRLADGDPTHLASDAVEAAKKEFPDLKKGDEEWTEFSSDLKALLSCDESLGVTAKVLTVRTDYQHVFCSARILTDIRPVFGPDPSLVPLAAAIVHTLHIEHHTEGSHKDFYVALDDRDLRKLQNQIERAKKKEDSLQSVIRNTSMKCLATGER